MKNAHFVYDEINRTLLPTIGTSTSSPRNLGGSGNYDEYTRINPIQTVQGYVEFDLKSLPPNTELLSKIHISLAAQQTAKAWNAIIDTLVENKVPAFKVITSNDEYQPGKSIVLYHNDNYMPTEGWASILQKIENILVDNDIQPGEPPHYRFGTIQHGVDGNNTPIEESIPGSNFLYYEQECETIQQYDELAKPILGMFCYINIESRLAERQAQRFRLAETRLAQELQEKTEKEAQEEAIRLKTSSDFEQATKAVDAQRSKTEEAMQTQQQTATVVSNTEQHENTEDTGERTRKRGRDKCCGTM
jgi:hypothetical protein